MNILKLIFLVLLPLALLIASYGGYRYASSKGLYDFLPDNIITYQRYNLNKTQNWPHRFDFMDSADYNSVKRTIVGTRENFLQVRRGWETYLIEYDTEIDLELISWVREVREQNDNTDYPSRYFLVQYDKFVEIVRFDPSLSTTPLSSEVSNGTYEASICLQLPIEAGGNVRYHVDPRGNIWIVTVSMNKVVFIQVYSCIEAKLVAEFRHILADGQNVNEVMRIVKKEGECMGVEVVTYGLNVVELQVCPYRTDKSIIERKDHRLSHHMEYEEVEVKDYQVLQGYTNGIYEQQWRKIIKYILSFFKFSPDSSLLYDRKPSLDENKKEPFDSITIDEQNHYLINFSQNTSHSGILSLAPYLINSKHPLFHNNPNYHKHDILKILDREFRKEYNPDIEHKYIVPGLNQTRKATYKAAYRIHPDTKVEYLGLTPKVIVFWPQDRLDEKDYSFVRTHEGGLVSQGNKFKGSFDKVPVQFEEVYQRVDAKPQEVIPNIFQAHAGYSNLMTYLIRSKEDDGFVRVELLNMLGGRPVLTHYLSAKEGFVYVSTTLLNNQWWVLQYSPSQQRSMATKYELYANASAPSPSILSLKRVYGVVGSEEHLNGEDDLAELMSEFSLQHGKGYLLLSVYRCIDEYYYVEYTDAEGSVFGVARIHFKNFSNRRVKKSKKYVGQFERMMVIDEKEMIPEKYSRKPYAVYLKNMDTFKHVPAFLAKNDGKNTWHQFCKQGERERTFRKLEKLGGFHYFPISHYALANYGCDFKSDRAHPESFQVFNLRSIVIGGKQQVQDRRQVRRDILNRVFYVSGGYLLLILLVSVGGLLSSRTKTAKNEGEKGKEKKN